MSAKRAALVLSVLSLVVVCVGCGGKLRGKYLRQLDGGRLDARDYLEFKPDGKVAGLGPGEDATYEVRGNKVTIHMRSGGLDATVECTLDRDTVRVPDPTYKLMGMDAARVYKKQR